MVLVLVLVIVFLGLVPVETGVVSLRGLENTPVVLPLPVGLPPVWVAVENPEDPGEVLEAAELEAAGLVVVLVMVFVLLGPFPEEGVGMGVEFPEPLPSVVIDFDL